MRLLFIVLIPSFIMLIINYFLKESYKIDYLNTFTGVLIGGLITFYTTSTFEGLKYRLNEKNNYLKQMAKMDLILNNNLKSLIHNHGSFEHFNENLQLPVIQELYIYPFLLDSTDFLSIGDLEVIKKIANCLIYFEHVSINMNHLKYFNSKILPMLEEALKSNNVERAKSIQNELENRSSSIRIIIKDSIKNAHKEAIETISLIQTKSKRVTISRKEYFIFGEISKVYEKDMDLEYFNERKSVLQETYKLI
ncbi:Hypothetical protein LBF_2153 [Leptospira biflexa serovar Patoc strain 'Patoc 1 (Ames)']|uniref:Uncharacterized protein n=1 Tax=Leptospira biflexa serovar Patoc (strain Patoc 1 / ATCC 23582 / Paris) TaxID=456481 RepID=B0ST73_LEPBP|nr:hypothetical protein [Leptospira biflexa]ABZ94650.1 Hypothetical protein LBF_2153 [Leptospira biflexa serovar Patoc strain 'Patoc 1 (Ames)']ABZ98313.1 Hypothetical protein LEPBI_I2215 [Leptospira biflexa serovar Patoc strain 'Patoc 1 (Paris)']